MAVKIFNRTRVDDSFLLPILRLAKRLAGAKGDVVVKVDARDSRHSFAKRAVAAKESFLLDRRRTNVPTDGETRGVLIPTEGGFVVIRLPHSWDDPLTAARRFVDTAIHEFAHVRDLQVGASFLYYRPGSRRLIPHDRRPHEIRAEDAVYEAGEKIRRSKCLKARVDAMIESLAAAIHAKYPLVTEEQRHIERNRRFHYRYCTEGNCWYCRYRREIAASKPRSVEGLSQVADVPGKTSEIEGVEPEDQESCGADVVQLQSETVLIVLSDMPTQGGVA